MAETDKLVKIILSVVNKSGKPLSEVIDKFDKTIKSLGTVNKKLDTFEQKVVSTTTKAAASSKQFSKKLDDNIKRNVDNLKKRDKVVESSGKKTSKAAKITSEDVVKASKKVNTAIKSTKRVIDNVNKSVKKATKSGKAIGSHAKAIAGTMTGASVSLGKLRRGVEKLGNTYDKTSRSSKNFRLQLTGLESFFISQGAAIAALIAIVSQLKTFINTAEQAQSAVIGLASIARYAGEDIGESLQEAARLSANGLIDVRSSAVALKNLLSRGFELDEAVKIVERLTDAAAFNRQASLSMSEAVRGATEGLKNENSVLVDNAGVTKNVSVMWAQYAKQLGKGAKSLTLAEKRQAEFNGIMEETAGMVGNAELALKTITGTKAQFGKAVFDLNSAIGTTLIPTFIVLTNILTWSFNNVLKPFFGGIEGLAVRMANLQLKIELIIGTLGKRPISSLKSDFEALDNLMEAEYKRITDKYEGIQGIPEIGKDTGKRRKDFDADIIAALGGKVGRAVTILSEFSRESKKIALETKDALLEIRLDLVEGIIKTEEEAEQAREQLYILEAERRLELVNKLLVTVKEKLGEESKEYQAMMLRKLDAEVNFAETKIKILERSQEKETELVTAKAKAELDAFLINTGESLHILESAYKNSEISIKAYFLFRRDIINLQYESERNKLLDLIEVEQDEVTLIELRTELLRNESEARQENIDLINQEKKALEKQEGAQGRTSGIGGSIRDKLWEEWYSGSKYGPRDKFQMMSDMFGQTTEMLGILSDESEHLSGVFKGLEDTSRILSDLFDPDYIENYWNKAVDAIHTGIQNAVVDFRSAWTGGFASGGEISGYSPNSKADNIPIMATAKEFMQPVDAVNYYGLPFMEAIRHKLISKDVFNGFRLPSTSRSIPKTNFSDGGSVVASNNSSYSVNVPVNVEGVSDLLSSRLQQGIEETVITIMREELA